MKPKKFNRKYTDVGFPRFKHPWINLTLVAIALPWGMGDVVFVYFYIGGVSKYDACTADTVEICFETVFLKVL